MPTSQEDVEKQIAQAEAKMAELKKQIVRADNWDQLFASPEEERVDYEEHLVGGALAEYKGNSSLKEHRVEPNPEGDIHVLEKTDKGSYSTYQKLNENRDVIITFNNPNEEPHRAVVTCGVGNISHPFTRANTFVPSSKILKQIGDEEIQRITGTNILALGFYSKGKPATEGWEETMLYNGHLPQRIGHRIFPDFVLKAQAKLMVARPQLFPPQK